MNNQITLAYLDYDDLDALQVVSVVSFYESFIDGAGYVRIIGVNSK